MTGRRCLTLIGLAAALMLIAPFESAWAHPGKSHGHASGHSYGHRNHADTVHTDTANAYTADAAHSARRAYGRTHAGLDQHPGKARGLFKHADRPGIRVGQQHHSPPPVSTGGRGRTPQRPPTFTGPTAEPQPTNPPANPHPGHNGHHSDPPATGPPPAPRSTQPPPERDPAAAAKVLLHSSVTRFTVLPILVVAMLALGVGGLVTLARHRA